MSCCYTNTLQLCNINGCSGEIDLGVEAPVPGEYKLYLNFLGALFIIAATFAPGDNMVFQSDQLNESYEYTGNVIDPSGDNFVITIDEINYDSIAFRTTSIFTI